MTSIRSPEALTLCSDSLNRSCGSTDDIDHQVWVGQHGDVTALDLSHFGVHTLREEAFEVGVNGAVVLVLRMVTRSVSIVILPPQT